MNGLTCHPAIWPRLILAVALSLSSVTGFAQDAKPAHPLDALTGAELSRVKAILTAEGKIGPAARFHSVDLDEPEKAAVLAWRPGTTLPRRAIAVVTEAGTVHEAAIDLSAGRTTGWRAVTGEPALLFGEMIGAGDMAKADPRMVEALAKRGVTPAQVYCLPLTTGNFGRKEEQGQRLLKVPCFAKPQGSNVWARPIEGLFATVDLKTGKAIDVTDSGVVPIPADGWGYDEAEIAARGALRPESKAGRPCPSRAATTSRPRTAATSGTSGASMCAPTCGRERCSRWSRCATARAGARSPTRCICPKFSCPIWTRTRPGTFEPTWTAANTVLAIS